MHMRLRHATTLLASGLLLSCGDEPAQQTVQDKGPALVIGGEDASAHASSLYQMPTPNELFAIVRKLNGKGQKKAMSAAPNADRFATLPGRALNFGVYATDMVYASNFTDTDITKFDAFLPVLEIFDPKVHLVKINTPKNFERSEDTYKAIDRFLQRHELRKFTTTVYNDLSVEEGILSFAKGIDADMIAMATHGRTGFFHVVNGSLTEDIVNHTTFPVLSVKL